MRIDAVSAYHVTLPFKMQYASAQALNRSSEIVVVEIRTDGNHIRGYGEGAPVKAVTGETAERVLKRLEILCKSPFFPWHINDIGQIWSFSDQLPQDKHDNTTICALELALLDAWGKFVNKPLVDLLPQRYRIDRIRYGAPISLGDKQSKRNVCQMIHSFGIQHVRAKMEASLERNTETFEAISEIIKDACILAIDPNGTWDRESAFRHLPLIRKHQVQVVEEPFSSSEDGFADFVCQLKTSNVNLMACESAPTIAEIKKIVADGLYDRVNVKLSRSGGIRRALKMIECLRQNGVSFQIGCTTGESGILSAAGRAFGLVNGDAVTYDGSYDAFLLEDNTTHSNVTFGRGGIAGPLTGPGLGVMIDKEKLHKLCNQRIVSIKKKGASWR